MCLLNNVAIINTLENIMKTCYNIVVENKRKEVPHMINGKSGRKLLLKIAVIIGILIMLMTSSNLTEVVAPIKYGATTSEDELVVHVIKCGQAEAILFVQGDTTALIDCGKVATGKDVVKYLQKLGITQLDFLIGTHFHEDHLGGMCEVLSNFEIGTIIFPKRDEEIEKKWYSKLMDKIQKGEYHIENAEPKDVYSIGEAKLKIVEAETEYGDNLNNSSIVSKVTFGEMDILLMADAEREIEEKLIKSAIDIDAEILKIGHHGSKTSNTADFIEKVDPDYALISCELGNEYGHPVKDTMSRLEDRNIEVHRTDECGSIVMTITHNSVDFNCGPGNYLSGSELKERIQ